MAQGTGAEERFVAFKVGVDLTLDVFYSTGGPDVPIWLWKPNGTSAQIFVLHPSRLSPDAFTIEPLCSRRENLNCFVAEEVSANMLHRTVMTDSNIRLHNMGVTKSIVGAAAVSEVECTFELVDPASGRTINPFAADSLEKVQVLLRSLDHECSRSAFMTVVSAADRATLREKGKVYQRDVIGCVGGHDTELSQTFELVDCSAIAVELAKLHADLMARQPSKAVGAMAKIVPLAFRDLVQKSKNGAVASYFTLRRRANPLEWGVSRNGALAYHRDINPDLTFQIQNHRPCGNDIIGSTPSTRAAVHPCYRCAATFFERQHAAMYASALEDFVHFSRVSLDLGEEDDFFLVVDPTDSDHGVYHGVVTPRQRFTNHMNTSAFLVHHGAPADSLLTFVTQLPAVVGDAFKGVPGLSIVDKLRERSCAVIVDVVARDVWVLETGPARLSKLCHRLEVRNFVLWHPKEVRAIAAQQWALRSELDPFVAQASLAVPPQAPCIAVVGSIAASNELHGIGAVILSGPTAPLSSLFHPIQSIDNGGFAGDLENGMPREVTRSTRNSDVGPLHEQLSGERQLLLACTTVGALKDGKAAIDQLQREIERLEADVRRQEALQGMGSARSSGLLSHVNAPDAVQASAPKAYETAVATYEEAFAEVGSLLAILHQQAHRREALSRRLRELREHLLGRRERFLLELLQNADDALYAADVVPRVTIEVNKNRDGRVLAIVVRSNESGLTPSDVRAMCLVNLSTKYGRTGFVGKKGIGFKSVFASARNVAVSSRRVCMQFVAPGDAAQDDDLWMITPSATQHRDSADEPEFVDGTQITLQDVSEECNAVELCRQVDPTMLLWFRKVRCLDLNGTVWTAAPHDDASAPCPLVCIAAGGTERLFGIASTTTSLGTVSVAIEVVSDRAPLLAPGVVSVVLPTSETTEVPGLHINSEAFAINVNRTHLMGNSAANETLLAATVEPVAALLRRWLQPTGKDAAAAELAHRLWHTAASLVSRVLGAQGLPGRSLRSWFLGLRAALKPLEAVVALGAPSSVVPAKPVIVESREGAHAKSQADDGDRVQTASDDDAEDSEDAEQHDDDVVVDTRPRRLHTGKIAFTVVHGPTETTERQQMDGSAAEMTALKYLKKRGANATAIFAVDDTAGYDIEVSADTAHFVDRRFEGKKLLLEVKHVSNPNTVSLHLSQNELRVMRESLRSLNVVYLVLIVSGRHILGFSDARQLVSSIDNPLMSFARVKVCNAEKRFGFVSKTRSGDAFFGFNVVAGAAATLLPGLAVEVLDAPSEKGLACTTVKVIKSTRVFSGVVNQRRGGDVVVATSDFLNGFAHLVKPQVLPGGGELCVGDQVTFSVNGVNGDTVTVTCPVSSTPAVAGGFAPHPRFAPLPHAAHQSPPNAPQQRRSHQTRPASTGEHQLPGRGRGGGYFRGRSDDGGRGRGLHGRGSRGGNNHHGNGGASSNKEE